MILIIYNTHMHTAELQIFYDALYTLSPGRMWGVC